MHNNSVEIITKNESAKAFHVSIFYHIIGTLLMPAVFLSLPLLSKNAESVFGSVDGLVDMLCASVIGIVVLNVGIYRYNCKKRIITSVYFDDLEKVIRIKYQKMYKKVVAEDAMKYSEMSFSNENKEVLPISINDKKIILNKNKVYFGELSLDGLYWNKEGAKINMIRNKLIKIKGFMNI